MSTNVSRAQPFIHQTGPAWWGVRCSMSILEYLPPMNTARRVRTVPVPSQSSQTPTETQNPSTVSSMYPKISIPYQKESFIYQNDADLEAYGQGDILIDGGYVNNLPVDVMASLYSPHIIVAADVENKEEGHLQNLRSWGDYMNGFSLVWKKISSYWSPFRSNFHVPKYSEIIDSLVYINHNGTVRSLIQSRLVQLYVRPRYIQDFKILDYDKADLISRTGYESTNEICSLVGLTPLQRPAMEIIGTSTREWSR